jgi:hypothetical protein
MLIIGVFALAGLAKWIFAPGRERLDVPLSPEEIELFGEYFDFEDEAANYEEMRKTKAHIWMDDFDD